ncbi:hypothetical protein MKW98_023520 [Papaver atlanticum]|uniref:Glutaredoxin domain-containing protein n=1 Tax=Papaver atlanticum TaxID=357466 RepID=A0AAD4XMD4_9MAGN|nr:hypothetical protein MKW98_023520 [Papaver atlanticum]
MEAIMRVASKKGVVIFSKSSCCMCYAVKILFHELGVNPLIHELDQDPEGREMEKALMRMGCNTPVPSVFINGEFVGSTNEVMSLHLGGTFRIAMDKVMKLASQKAVVIFSKSTCCMSHAIKSLFYDLGVSPAIYELDEESRGREMEKALQRLGCNPTVPAVFIGGKLVSSTNTIMSLHLSGALIPMLKEAGAIWL